MNKQTIKRILKYLFGILVELSLLRHYGVLLL